jgi:adenosylcobinamide kinase/adenosylcobinamide-phosphate guanylyltransferase
MSKARAILVLGGARSGKSRYAETLLAASGRTPIVIATAEAGDAEMAERIEAHRAARPAGWRTIETPLDLAAAIRSACQPDHVVLVDCVTLWLCNLFMAERAIMPEVQALAETVAQAAGPLVLVSNEVGGGIVPDSDLGRRFRDEQGWLNQRLAQVCDHVVLVTAGLPQLLKPGPMLDLTFRD